MGEGGRGHQWEEVSWLTDLACFVSYLFGQSDLQLAVWLSDFEWCGELGDGFGRLV